MVALPVERICPERVLAQALGITRPTLARWMGRLEVRLALDVRRLMWWRQLYRAYVPKAARLELGLLLPVGLELVRLVHLRTPDELGVRQLRTAAEGKMGLLV